MTIRSALSLLALIIATSFGLRAQYGPQMEPPEMSSKYNPVAWRGGDFDFGVEMLHSSYCAYQISNYVAANSTNKALRNLAFAQAYDQQKIYNTLRSMAKTLDVPLPPKRKLQDCTETARLRELSGEELDREYVTFISKNSVKNVERFENEAQMPRLPSNWSLWSFARKMLPVVRQDAGSVKTVQQELAAKK